MFPPRDSLHVYSYFEKHWRKKMCTWQPQKIIWDMINTLFLTLKLSRLLLLLAFSTRKHTSMASRDILSNFFEKKWIQNHAQYLSGLSRALFPTTFLEIAVYSCQCEVKYIAARFLRRSRTRGFVSQSGFPLLRDFYVPAHRNFTRRSRVNV